MERTAKVQSAMQPNRRIYETGDFSDFIIETSTKDFKVHKAIICEKSPMFYAACTRDFQEAKNGRMGVEEPEEIMESLLRGIYGLDVPLLNVEDIKDTISSDEIERRFKSIIELHTAGDRYQISGATSLDDQVYHALNACVDACIYGVRKQRWQVSSLIVMGLQVHGNAAELLAYHRFKLAMHTAMNIEGVIDNEEAWDALHSNTEYAKATTRHLAHWIPTKLRKGSDQSGETPHGNFNWDDSEPDASFRALMQTSEYADQPPGGNK